MFNKLFYFIIAFTLLSCSSQSSGNANDSEQGGTIVLIKTSAGKIKIRLYDETPKHRDNFIKLVNEKYYEGMLFHRVIKNFMIQTGDPDSKNAPAGKQLGMGGPGYTIEAEFMPNLYHKKGTLAAARQGDQVNPDKRSSGSQFYIIQGEVFTPDKLDMMEQNINLQNKQNYAYKMVQDPKNAEFVQKIRDAQANNDAQKLQELDQQFRQLLDEEYASVEPYKFTEEQRQVYSTTGGAPHLDGQYTVFGEVIEGLDIIDQIALVETDQYDRPKEDITIISMEIIK